VSFNPEILPPETDELIVTRPSKRAEDFEVVDCLQQVGLALTVVTYQGRSALWKLNDLVIKIPEIPEAQPLEKHLENLGILAAFSRCGQAKNSSISARFSRFFGVLRSVTAELA
jgi:hypothetical protein